MFACGTPHAAESLRLGECSVEVLQARVERRAFLDIVSLAVSLLGFIGLIFVVWQMKTGVFGTPRALYLLFIGMACAPFYVAFVRIPKIPFLLPPVIALFLLYPIGAPHGVVYSTDPIFNFSFTQDLLRTGFWAPGASNAFATTYSFYPIGNVFVGYVILNAPLPPDIGYLWIEPVLRLLAIPASVYAFGRRLFGPRTAAIGVLLYLGTPSILFNDAVQQGFGTIFFALSLLALFMLVQAVGLAAQRRAMVLFAVVSTGIVMTHHLSSYVFAFWVTALGFLMVPRRARKLLPVLRLIVLFAYFVVALLVYINILTKAIFLIHESTLTAALRNLIAPETAASGSGSNLGRTFTQIEIGWLVATLIGLFVLAFSTAVRHRATRHNPFDLANGIVASFLVFVTLPLVVTPLNYVPLRINEYAGFIVMPFAAATLIRWARSDFWKSARRAPQVLRERPWIPRLVVVAIAGGIVMGGNLAPITLRGYFESFNSRATDSPLYLGVDSIRVSDWATDHFADGRMWGDQLANDVFAGFGFMPVEFGATRIFGGTVLNESAWCLLKVRDYVAVDYLMTILRPNFLHEGLWPTPMSAAQVGKFATDPHFAMVYRDATFTIYRVMLPSPFPPCL